jgi:hypothetical protein
MEVKLIEYTLSPKQKEVLQKQYEKAIKFIKGSKHFVRFDEKQFDLILKLFDNQQNHDFLLENDGKTRFVRIKNFRVANEIGHDYELYYNIVESYDVENIEHMPVLIGFKNKDGLYFNIDAVY